MITLQQQGRRAAARDGGAGPGSYLIPVPFCSWSRCVNALADSPRRGWQGRQPGSQLRQPQQRVRGALFRPRLRKQKKKSFSWRNSSQAAMEGDSPRASPAASPLRGQRSPRPQGSDDHSHAASFSTLQPQLQASADESNQTQSWDPTLPRGSKPPSNPGPCRELARSMVKLPSRKSQDELQYL